MLAAHDRRRGPAEADGNHDRRRQQRQGSGRARRSFGICRTPSFEGPAHEFDAGCRYDGSGAAVSWSLVEERARARARFVFRRCGVGRGSHAIVMRASESSSGSLIVSSSSCQSARKTLPDLPPAANSPCLPKSPSASPASRVGQPAVENVSATVSRRSSRQGPHRSPEPIEISASRSVCRRSDGSTSQSPQPSAARLRAAGVVAGGDHAPR